MSTIKYEYEYSTKLGTAKMSLVKYEWNKNSVQSNIGTGKYGNIKTQIQ